jgi:ribosomal protein S25
MSHPRLAAAFVLLLGIAVPLAAQDTKDKNKDKNKATAADTKDKDKSKDKDQGGKAELKWKFEKGKPFYQKMTTTTEQTMKVMNNDVKQTQKQTFYFSWTPVEQKGDAWVLKQKIEGVAMDIDIGGSKIQYDSTKENTATNPLGEFFKALVGAEFTITLDMKKVEVTNVEGRKKFLDDLVKANPQMKPLLDQILSEKALKEMAEPTFAVVPDKAVTKGDHWERKSTLDMGPIGKYENKYTYTYEGKDPKDNKLDKIKVDTQLTYKEPGDVAGVGGLPFKIKSADLKSTKASGEVLFDGAKGRVQSSKSEMELSGKLSIEIGGQTTTVDLSQTQKTDVETSDTNPVTPAKK